MFKLICVTNRLLCQEDFGLRLAKIAAGRPDAVLLREKDLPPEEYQQLAAQAMAICRENQVPCLLHSFPKAALSLQAAGLHLPLPQLAKLPQNQLRQLRWRNLGTSCHSLADLQQAQALGCAYIFAGHIFATDCKPGLPGRGLSFLRQICAAAEVPVYAIGGINSQNIARVQAAGAAGACLMSSLMTCANPAALLAELRAALREKP